VSARTAIVAAAGAGALLLVLLVGTGLGWWGGGTEGAAPAKRLVVRTSLEPRPTFFGDAVTARIDVQVDPGLVSADSIRVVPSFEPFVPAGSPQVTRSRSGRREIVSYRYTIQCHADECLPTPKKETRWAHAVALKPVVVTAESGGQQLKASARWPKMTVMSRMQKGDIGSGEPSFRRPTTMPAASYRVAPGAAANVLTIVAALLGLLAIALLVRELLAYLERRRRRALVRLTPLEEALAYTRDAAHRPDPADRRRALELLARTLEREGVPDLAGTAGDVAWSEESPSSDSALELADRVEVATRNGR
jgi:hypothetical protein